MIRADTSGLFGLLDQINTRPQLMQLGARQAQNPTNLWDMAQQEKVEPTVTPQEIVEQVYESDGGSSPFVEDAIGAVGQSMGQGALDSIFSGSDLMDAIGQSGGNLGLFGANFGANKMAKDYGFDLNNGSSRAATVGNILGTMALGPFGGVAGGLLGKVGLDAYQDYSNTRDFEQAKDYLEDTLGYFDGHRSTGRIAQGNMFGGWTPSSYLTGLDEFDQDNYENLHQRSSLFEAATKGAPLWNPSESWDNAGTGNFSAQVDHAYSPEKQIARQALLDYDPDIHAPLTPAEANARKALLMSVGYSDGGGGDSWSESGGGPSTGSGLESDPGPDKAGMGGGAVW